MFRHFFNGISTKSSGLHESALANGGNKHYQYEEVQTVYKTLTLILV